MATAPVFAVTDTRERNFFLGFVVVAWLGVARAIVTPLPGPPF